MPEKSKLTFHTENQALKSSRRAAKSTNSRPKKQDRPLRPPPFIPNSSQSVIKVNPMLQDKDKTLRKQSSQGFNDYQVTTFTRNQVDGLYEKVQSLPKISSINSSERQASVMIMEESPRKEEATARRDIDPYADQSDITCGNGGLKLHARSNSVGVQKSGRPRHLAFLGLQSPDAKQPVVSNSTMKDLSVTHVEVQKEVKRVMGRINKLSQQLNVASGS